MLPRLNEVRSVQLCGTDSMGWNWFNRMEMPQWDGYPAGDLTKNN